MIRFVFVVIVLALACHWATARERATFEVNDDKVLLTSPTVPSHPDVAAMTKLGKKLFFDPRLSATHKMSCASCHDPAFAYGPPNALAVQLGGNSGRQQGQRAVPSLRYLERIPVFTENYFDEDFDESIDNGPTGGLMWDGRVQNPHEQAQLPLMSPLEMANTDIGQVVAAVKGSAYSAEFRRVFGDDIFASPQRAFAAITRSLEVFQQDPQAFYPYSSKYDAYLRRQVQLTAQEQRGLELFNDPAKGNCAHCHQSAIGSSGAFPAFTDFGYAALGVPRNQKLRQNSNRDFYDLGLCGPLRKDLQARNEYCGLFRAPSLRNVALRRTFFHNGIFHSLEQVLHFYVERDIHPEKWYSRDARNRVRIYDDLPAQYRENINVEAPFDRHRGDRPALDDAEIADIIAFLNTLTDGWTANR